MDLIYKLMFEHSMARTVKIFFKNLDPDVYLTMNLGKHFLGKHNSKEENKSLDIIKFIRAERPRLTLDEFVMKEEAYKKLEVILNDFNQDPEQQKKYFIDQEEIIEAESKQIEEIEDIQIEDDIQNDGEYLKEPTTWAEINEEDDDLFDFLREEEFDGNILIFDNFK